MLSKLNQAKFGPQALELFLSNIRTEHKSYDFAAFAASA
jgi:hypothetical protein